MSIFENSPCKYLTKIQKYKLNHQDFNCNREKKKRGKKYFLNCLPSFTVIVFPNYTDFFVADYHTVFLSRICKAMHKNLKEKRECEI